jgi:hypothetical protein
VRRFRPLNGCGSETVLPVGFGLLRWRAARIPGSGGMASGYGRTRRAIGRHRHQHRAIDDCRAGWTGGRRARSYPHRRGTQPGAEARAAHGPETEVDGGAAGRGAAATGGGCYAYGTRAQLWRAKEHDFTTVTDRGGDSRNNEAPISE